METYYHLFADPSIDRDKKIIELFNHSSCSGVLIPTSAGAGPISLEYTDEKGIKKEIEGNNNVLDFLNSMKEKDRLTPKFF